MPCKDHCVPEAATHIQYAQDVGRYLMSIAVVCAVCKTRFKFLNVPHGIDWDGVRSSSDSLELYAGIHRADATPPPVPLQGEANG